MLVISVETLTSMHMMVLLHAFVWSCHILNARRKRLTKVVLITENKALRKSVWCCDCIIFLMSVLYCFRSLAIVLRELRSSAFIALAFAFWCFWAWNFLRSRCKSFVRLINLREMKTECHKSDGKRANLFCEMFYSLRITQWSEALILRGRQFELSWSFWVLFALPSNQVQGWSLR